MSRCILLSAGMLDEMTQAIGADAHPADGQPQLAG